MIENPATPDASEPWLPAVAATPADPVELSPSTRDRLRRAMPESARRAYTGDLRRFLSWSADRTLLPPGLASPTTTGSRTRCASCSSGTVICT